MNAWINAGWAWLTGPNASRYLEAAVLGLVGLLLARWTSAAAAKLVARHRGANSAMVTRRLTAYGLYLLVTLMVLQHLGLKLSVLLGAAGLLTVAIGFAAQTSASNLIAGLFLMGERPFVVGDVVEIDTVLGEVISIDLLSVKLRSFDNLLVRIPNETMVKARLTNYTHHPIRRVEVPFSVAYAADLKQVEAVLQAVAHHHPHAFDEPAPMILFQAFGASSIDGVFRVWTTRELVLSTRSELIVKVKQGFEAAGIEIPFPQQVVHYRATPPAGPAGPAA